MAVPMGYGFVGCCLLKRGPAFGRLYPLLNRNLSRSKIEYIGNSATTVKLVPRMGMLWLCICPSLRYLYEPPTRPSFSVPLRKKIGHLSQTL